MKSLPHNRPQKDQERVPKIYLMVQPSLRHNQTPSKFYQTLNLLEKHSRARRTRKRYQHRWHQLQEFPHVQGIEEGRLFRSWNCVETLNTMKLRRHQLLPNLCQHVVRQAARNLLLQIRLEVREVWRQRIRWVRKPKKEWLLKNKKNPVHLQQKLQPNQSKLPRQQARGKPKTIPKTLPKSKLLMLRKTSLQEMMMVPPQSTQMMKTWLLDGQATTKMS